MLCVCLLLTACRGEVADAVVMEKKNYGFVTFADPKNAMKFLEVCSIAAAALAAWNGRCSISISVQQAAPSCQHQVLIKCSILGNKTALGIARCLVDASLFSRAAQ